MTKFRPIYFCLCFSIFLLTACNNSSTSPSAQFELLITISDSEIKAGGTSQLNVLARDVETNIESDVTNSASFSTDNFNIALVESGGLVIAKNVGTVTIGVWYLGQFEELPLTITEGVIKSIEITGGDLNLHIGTSSQLTAIATYQDNTTDDITSVGSWRSVDSNIASIYKGLLQGHSFGLTDIYISYMDLDSERKPVTIDQGQPSNLIIIYSSYGDEVRKGNKVYFFAKAVWPDGNEDYITEMVNWQSNDENILINTPYSATFSAINEGSADVETEYMGITEQVTIDVMRPLVNSLYVELDAGKITGPYPTNYFLQNNDTAQLSAIAELQDGSTDVDVSSQVEWRWSSEGSSGEVSIDENNQITALKRGFVIISAGMDGRSSGYRDVALWIDNLPDE